MTSALPTAETVALRTLLIDDPKVMALKTGQVRSPLVTFDFTSEKNGYRKLVRDLKFDCGDLPIGAYLQARTFGKPLLLMPVVVTGRFHHDAIFYNPARGRLNPGDLEGCRVGANAYTHTSGIWIRGVLETEYGLDLSRIEWVTMMDGYLDEYCDPENCRRATSGATLHQLLIDGELDAAVLGAGAASDERLKPLFPDPPAAARAWHRKYGAVPMNHMLVIRESLCQSRPDTVRELYRLFVNSKAAAPRAADALDLTPYGIEENRKALELVVAHAVRQKVIPRAFAVDDLFGDVAQALRA